MIFVKLNVKSDQRSTVAPSDSERDCSSSKRNAAPKKPSAPSQQPLSAPAMIPAALQGSAATNPADSESGGSLSPSPRANRKRQVVFFCVQYFLN